MVKNASEIKQQCLSKWSAGLEFDDCLSKFNVSFDEWLNQIPVENRDTVLTLIENMEYYPHEITNDWLKKLHIQLLKNDNITDNNTIYVFIKSKDGATNSSNDYWSEYKFINRINKHICIEDMNALNPKAFAKINNIVFVDDFSGSGKSFIDELKKNPSRYANKNVFFITINIMENAITAINEYGKENNINIVLLSALKQKKAFERELFFDDNVARKEIENMSESFEIPNNEILGYLQTEALVAFYNNTPNNTLGFIRYDTKGYKSIFPRKNDPLPSWRYYEKNKSKRKKMNYTVKAKG